MHQHNRFFYYTHLFSIPTFQKKKFYRFYINHYTKYKFSKKFTDPAPLNVLIDRPSCMQTTTNKKKQILYYKCAHLHLLGATRRWCCSTSRRFFLIVLLWWWCFRQTIFLLAVLLVCPIFKLWLEGSSWPCRFSRSFRCCTL